MSRTKFIYLVKILFLFSIYFFTAKFGLSLEAVSRFATLIWIPTGLSLTALFFYGISLWPAIFVGAFLVNVTTGAPVLVALGMAVGNTLEAVVGVYFLKRVVGSRTPLDKLRDVLLFILFVVPISTALSATIGVTSLFLGHVILSSSYTKTWASWWIGDFISDLIIAPFLIFLLRREPIITNPLKIIECIVLFLFVITIGFFVFIGFGNEPMYTNFPMRYLVYPTIIWASLRFGQREVASTILIYAAIAIWATIIGFGPFVKGNIAENLFFLQFFMIITSVTALILSVIVSEKRELEGRKDDFISLASHELRTPVTTLKLYAEVINQKLTQKKITSARRNLVKLENQIYKMDGLLVDLLDVSRIQSGNLKINMEQFNFNMLLIETIESLQKTTNNHTLVTKGKIDQEILGDKERIYQVLANLLANAIKYSPKGGKIIVTCKRIKKAIQVSVKDGGIGIEKSQLQKIFEKLYRIQNQSSNIYPGLGIGLFVCAEIIKMHKGKIWAESTKGKGATFYFTLPITTTVSKRLTKPRNLFRISKS